jgi:hypothetical protein
MLLSLALGDHGKTSAGDLGDEPAGDSDTVDDADDEFIESAVSDAVTSWSCWSLRMVSDGESDGVAATESSEVDDELLLLANVSDGGASGDRGPLAGAGETGGDSGRPGEAGPPANGGSGDEGPTPGSWK